MNENNKYKIILDYNPYTQKVLLKTSDKGFDCSHGLCNSPFKELLPKLVEKIDSTTQGKDSIDFTFEGREYEFTLIKSEIELKYELTNKKFDFKHTHKYEYNIKKIEKQINELPEKIFENKSKRDLILKQLDSNIEMFIVGLYNSGKSTLINAMIGESVLFTHSDEATMKLYKIIDSDEKFIQVKTKDNKLTYEKSYQDILSVADILKSHNEDNNIDEIHLGIDIPHIDSSHFKLALIDSPGVNTPNNKYQTMVFDAINDGEKNFPPIVMVLNANNYKSNDQNGLFDSLLNTIKNVQKDTTPINLERFFFIINRADEIKFEEYQGIYQNIKQLIEDKIGNGAKIYSSNAELALLIRKQLKFNQPNKMVKRFIDDIKDNEVNYLPKFSTRSTSNQPVVFYDDDSEQTKLQKALEYTGIPMIEEAFQEYLTNHAVVQVLEYIFQKLEEIEKFKNDENIEDNKKLQEKKEEKRNLTTENKPKEKQLEELQKQKDLYQQKITQNKVKKENLEKFINALEPAKKKYEKEINSLKVNDNKLNKLQHDWVIYCTRLQNKEQGKTYKNDNEVLVRIKNIEQNLNIQMQQIYSQANVEMRKNLRNNAKKIVDDFKKVIDENITYLGEEGEKFKNEVNVKLEDDTTLNDPRLTKSSRPVDIIDISTLGIARLFKNNIKVDINSIKGEQTSFKNQLDVMRSNSERVLEELKKQSEIRLRKFDKILQQNKTQIDEEMTSLEDNSSKLEETTKNIIAGESEQSGLKEKVSQLEQVIEDLNKKIKENETIQTNLNNILKYWK